MRKFPPARTTWACIGIALILGLIGGRHAAGQALPTATGPGAYVIVGATYSGFESSYGEQKISGASFYVDTNFIWRYGLETEVRRMAYPHFGERQSTLLTGPRWSFRPKGFVPYAKFLVGGGRFDFPYGFGYGNYFVVAPGAGVDLRVGREGAPAARGLRISAVARLHLRPDTPVWRQRWHQLRSARLRRARSCRDSALHSQEFPRTQRNARSAGLPIWGPRVRLQTLLKTRPCRFLR